MSRTHGLSKERIYRVWCAMLERCYKPENKNYPTYGGRGVRVCEFLRSSPVNLVISLGPKPTQRHSIDRIDNNGHYSCGHCSECLKCGYPSNLRWATQSVQIRNSSRVIMLERNGEVRCIADWAIELGINRNTISRRIKRGLDPFEWRGSRSPSSYRT